MSNEKMRAEAFAACPDGIDWGAFWLGYKASRAALCVELPKIVNSEWACTSDECAAMRDAIRFCKHAIESAGVRTR